MFFTFTGFDSNLEPMSAPVIPFEIIALFLRGAFAIRCACWIYSRSDPTLSSAFRTSSLVGLLLDCRVDLSEKVIILLLWSWCPCWSQLSDHNGSFVCGNLSVLNFFLTRFFFSLNQRRDLLVKWAPKFLQPPPKNLCGCTEKSCVLQIAISIILMRKESSGKKFSLLNDVFSIIVVSSSQYLSSTGPEG